jgi:hypothetical protein
VIVTDRKDGNGKKITSQLKELWKRYSRGFFGSN